MKKLFLIIAVLFSVNSFAQKSDTLVVPVGKYKFVRIGDKVYEIEIKLKEVEKPSPEIQSIWGRGQGGIFLTPNLTPTTKIDTTINTFGATLEYRK